MLKSLLGSLFRFTPVTMRRCFARFTNTRFSVTAGAIVLDNQERVLLLKHVFRSGSGWGIPGGFVQAGEQPEEAVRRELREEVGLELVAVEMVLVRTLKRIPQMEIVFRCRAQGAPRPQSVEIIEADWFRLDELPEMLSSDQRSLINRVLGRGAK